MTLRNRFGLVLLGIIIFLLTTPFLVLYARGFKIDWENRAIVKTGALVVRSEPDDAEIFINDKKQNPVTPANIRFLLPGDYTVRVEKEGYQSWTKRLSIKSQFVTWANSDREFLTLFYKSPKETGRWNRSNIDFKENPELEAIEALLETPLSSEVADINALLTKLSIPIPKYTTGRIVPANGQNYLILDQTLYLVEDHMEKIYAPVTEARYENETKQLLYANSNEIFIYNTYWKGSDLILRSITPLTNPVFNPTTGYVFFQNEGNIKAIEFDGRDHRNIFTVAPAQDNFAVTKNGKKLFTVGQNIIIEWQIRE